MGLEALRNMASGEEELEPPYIPDETEASAPSAPVPTVSPIAATGQSDSGGPALTVGETTALDPALGDLDIAPRDIGADSVAPPPTRTSEEIESAAGSLAPVGGDPIIDTPTPAISASVSSAPETSAPATAETPSSEPAADGGEGGESKTPEEDPELDPRIQRYVASLPEDRRASFLADLKHRRAALNSLEKKEAALEAAAIQSAGHGGKGSVAGALAGMFGGNKLASVKREIASARQALAPESLRGRVLDLRKEEIIDLAGRLDGRLRRMDAASSALNAAIASTPDGVLANDAIEGILRQHPDLTRPDIVRLSKNGTLADRLGAADPVKPHWNAAFAKDEVRSAWEVVERESDEVVEATRRFTDRLKEFEEHFPDVAQSDEMAQTVSKAADGIQQSFDKLDAHDPEADERFKKKVQDIAKAVGEFLERLLSKVGFGPKP